MRDNDTSMTVTLENGQKKILSASPEEFEAIMTRIKTGSPGVAFFHGTEVQQRFFLALRSSVLGITFQGNALVGENGRRFVADSQQPRVKMTVSHEKGGVVTLDVSVAEYDRVLKYHEANHDNDYTNPTYFGTDISGNTYRLILSAEVFSISAVVSNESSGEILTRR